MNLRHLKLGFEPQPMPYNALKKLQQNATQSQAVVIVKHTPKFITSAAFGVLYTTAALFIVLGTIFSFSRENAGLEQAYFILILNAVLIVILAVYLGYRVWVSLIANKSRPSAPLLHRRFVLIFSLAALMPAFVVGAFSTSLIRQNISNIVGSDVRENMQQARAILADYVDQEFLDLTSDINTLKIALDNNRDDLRARISYTAELDRFATVRELDAIYIFRKDGSILARVEKPGAPPTQVPLRAVFDALNDGEIAQKKREDSNFLIAMTRLESYEDAFLYIGHSLRSNSQVLSSISGIENATQQLTQFNSNVSRRNTLFLLTFLETAVLILMTAIWVGIIVANRIIDPLSGLINAAERVRAGDMNTRVQVTGHWAEISDLSGAFNRMTQQLNSQRDELIREHDLSEQRRQFSEAVLSGVRAGVIGLGQAGKITLLNASAKRLLGLRADALIGQPIDKVLLEFMPAFILAREAFDGTAEDQVTLKIEEIERNFDLRVSAYQGAREDTGWVLTFDDMTRLVSAQRHSAWREVARRIAHEIKNPLTPIQLSAERLDRKYYKEITTDPETFKNCTQTIIRQVNSLEQMVNEFSAFARMPAPEFARIDLQAIIKDILFEVGVSFPDIDFNMAGTMPENIPMEGDERLLMQALTNIYKNAGEAVMRHIDDSGDDMVRGKILTDVSVLDDKIKIIVTDNGAGWPVQDKHRLLEPYVTTRETGTGLGLTIVNRIIEDHEGTVILSDREDNEHGAVVIITLPLWVMYLPNINLDDDVHIEVRAFTQNHNDLPPPKNEAIKL
ncbi:MAG: ATP-binding protein [Litorimonas sp.]